MAITVLAKECQFCIITKIHSYRSKSFFSLYECDTGTAFRVVLTDDLDTEAKVEK